MRLHTEILKLDTNKELELINITDKIKDIVSCLPIKNGRVNLFSKHTTMSIKINEDEKFLLKDLQWLMTHIAPEDNEYEHDKIHLRPDCPANEPKNAKGHLRSMLMETSQMIPLLSNELQLGKYQSIFAVETSGPRAREIVVQVFGEP
ncbi:MAG: secondary thiamine-phosphate synthase enzyme YjbQ [Nanoarchaeota archaeon]|nr:secondary thiamine-phosphate synthase enzyme YjbQ [Nanoarchaeota archaeon]